MEFVSSDGRLDNISDHAHSSDNVLRTRQLCYVCEKVSEVYLSRQGCIALGMLDSNFPTPQYRGDHETAATAEVHNCF